MFLMPCYHAALTSAHDMRECGVTVAEIPKDAVNPGDYIEVCEMLKIRMTWPIYVSAFANMPSEEHQYELFERRIKWIFLKQLMRQALGHEPAFE